MGKKIATWTFLVLLCGSLYVFFSKDDKDLRESVKAVPASIPRVTLKRFEINKYSNTKKEMVASAQLAYFIEPDLLEVYGKVSASDFRKEDIQKASGDTLTAYFDSNGLVELVKKSGIKKTEKLEKTNGAGNE